MKTCVHCGADYGLHHYETQQCPMGGVEETRDKHVQQWASTTFCDAGVLQLGHVSSKLLSALKVTFNALQTYGDHPIIRHEVESAIRAAEGDK